MTKPEFIAKLRAELADIPEKDAEDRIVFYSEMIDDRMEEGLSEEDAIMDVGSIDEIVSQIKMGRNTPETAENQPKRKIRLWEIVLLVLGSPVWVSLLISAFAVVFSLYMVLWSVIISLWAVEVSFCGTAFGCLLSGIVFLVSENIASGIAMIGVGIFFAGLSIFFLFACKSVTNGILILTKKIALRIKKSLSKKEAA